MTGRDRSYGRSRQASLKAKLGIATAVLVGGGAIGVAAVAANSHTPTSTASSAGYYSNSSNGFGQWSLLNSAMSTGNWNTSFADFSRTSTRNFNQWWFHQRMLAVQRGIVVLVTKKFIILQSKNGNLHLWWLSGNTVFKNASTTMTSANALFANTAAASSMMNTGNMVPATNVMTTTTTATALLTPVTTTKTIQVAVAGTGTVVTVAVTQTTATVITRTTTTTTTVVQNAFFQQQQIMRGDLALIAGFRSNWNLHAKVVLFAPLTSSDLTGTGTGTGISTGTGTGSSVGVSGSHS